MVAERWRQQLPQFHATRPLEAELTDSVGPQTRDIYLKINLSFLKKKFFLLNNVWHDPNCLNTTWTTLTWHDTAQVTYISHKERLDWCELVSTEAYACQDRNLVFSCKPNPPTDIKTVTRSWSLWRGRVKSFQVLITRQDVTPFIHTLLVSSLFLVQFLRWIVSRTANQQPC